MRRFVQPDPETGYRITAYYLKDVEPWPLTEIGYIYHRLDLSDLSEPYLSAVKKSLAADLTPKLEG